MRTWNTTQRRTLRVDTGMPPSYEVYGIFVDMKQRLGVSTCHVQGECSILI